MTIRYQILGVRPVVPIAERVGAWVEPVGTPVVLLAGDFVVHTVSVHEGLDGFHVVVWVVPA